MHFVSAMTLAALPSSQISVMTSSGNNPAARTVRRHYDELVRAVQEPFLLATGLYAKEIITQIVMDKVREQQMPSIQKTGCLLSAAIDHITHKPESFVEFLTILKKPGLDSAVIVEVSQSMETCYAMLTGTSVVVCESENTLVNLATTQQEKSEEGLRGEKVGLIEEVQELRREVEELRGALTTAEKSKKLEKEPESEAAVKSADVSMQVDLEQTRIAELEEQVVWLQQQFREEQDERVRLKDVALREQQVIVDTKTSELKATQQQLQDRAQENTRLALRVQQLNEQVNPLMDQIKQGEKDLEAKAAECSDLYQQLKAQIESREEQLEAKVVECNDLRRQLQVVEDGEAQWRERVHKLKEQVGQKYKSAVCDLGNLTETSKQQGAKIREQEDVIDQLKVQVDQHYSVIHQQRAVILAKDAKFTEQTTAMAAQVEIKSKTLEQQQEILDNSLARVAELEGGKRKMEGEMEQLRMQNGELLCWIEQGTKEFNQEFKSKTAEVNTFRIQLEEAQGRLEEAQGLHQRVSELEEECTQRQSRVTELEVQISQQLLDRRELQAKHDEKIRERTEWFQSVLDVKELEKRNLEEHLKIVCSQLRLAWS